jgi:hypothetical protein
MKTKASLGAYVVMYVVKNKKGDVIALLLKNGVVVPSNSNDMQVALVITEMLKKSKSFEKDFTKLVQSQDVVSGLSANMSGMYSNMSGAYSPKSGAYANAYGFEYDQSFNPTDPLFKSLSSQFPTTTNPKTTSTNTTNADKTGADKISGFEKYLLLGSNLFSEYTKMKENDAKVQLANASVEIEKLQSESGNGGNKDDEFNATPIYVVLGLIGLGLLGFLTYKMTKK